MESNGYLVVREFGGYGVGLDIYEDLFVFYFGKRGIDMVLVFGMVFIIELMVNVGSYEIFIDENNGWIVLIIDGFFLV